jgi:hypothetical protein
MLDGPAVLREANEVDVLDRERLVRRRQSRRQPALSSSRPRPRAPRSPPRGVSAYTSADRDTMSAA